MPKNEHGGVPGNGQERQPMVPTIAASEVDQNAARFGEAIRAKQVLPEDTARLRQRQAEIRAKIDRVEAARPKVDEGNAVLQGQFDKVVDDTKAELEQDVAGLEELVTSNESELTAITSQPWFKAEEERAQQTLTREKEAVTLATSRPAVEIPVARQERGVETPLEVQDVQIARAEEALHAPAQDLVRASSSPEVRQFKVAAELRLAINEVSEALIVYGKASKAKDEAQKLGKLDFLRKRTANKNYEDSHRAVGVAQKRVEELENELNQCYKTEFKEEVDKFLVARRKLTQEAERMQMLILAQGYQLDRGAFDKALDGKYARLEPSYFAPKKGGDPFPHNGAFEDARAQIVAYLKDETGAVKKPALNGWYSHPVDTYEFHREQEVLLGISPIEPVVGGGGREIFGQVDYLKALALKQGVIIDEGTDVEVKAA